MTFHGEIDFYHERHVLEDLPNIVSLEPGEVRLYPQPGSIPADGMGLNKPATITLYGCMPPSDGACLDAADAKVRYRDRIARMTEATGARFVDYDCDRGIRQISVDHF